MAWYILLTDKGKFKLIFFCQRVAIVTDIREIKAAKIPIVGRFEPISKPKTKIAPRKPSNTPLHCFNVIFSLSRGPAKILVRIGCKVTIKAVIPVGTPFEIEKKTPPKYKPWNKTPLRIVSQTFLLKIRILYFWYMENIKKPKNTMKNLSARAANGELSFTIGFVVINAEDQSIIKKSGKNLIIFNNIAQIEHEISTSSPLSCI